MKVLLPICWLVSWGMFTAVYGQEQHYKTTEGQVTFVSNAPLEQIEAHSDALRGIIDAKSRTFAFTLPVQSFQGFNSPLQQEHFNENYLESERYTNGQFAGKILEAVDLTRPGTYHVRAKGVLEIHGVGVERIVPATITVENNQMRLQSDFTLPLSDHDVTIPRIVRQKIAEDIAVTVEAILSL